MIVSRLAGRASASLIDQIDVGAARFATGRVAAFHTAAAPGPMAAAQTPAVEPSHGYLEGSAVGSAFSNLQPSLALIQVMPLTGYYPQRDGPDGSSYGFQLGQVRTTAGSFSFAETNADGQLIPINQRTALFSILGVTYGGNGTTTFALPDLGGVLTVGAGNGPGLSNFELGEAFGSSTVNLTAAQMPSAAGGGGQGFGNAQESLALRWVIAVDGFFPTEDSGSGADADMMGMLSQWAGNFEPAGFMYADGRELQISQWPSLYAIIGTRYGGDGVTTFRIPDLQGRVAVGADSNSPVGTVTGAELTNLTTSQLPVGAGGSSFPVSNLQPTLAVTYLIVSDGIYPTRDSSAVPDLVYMGEIIAFAGDFVPAGYFAANGQVLPISQYQALFSLMGTTYGGDGITTFALPNLNDRAVIGTGYNPSLGNVYIGQTFGSDSVTLTTTNVVNVAPTILDLQTTDTGVEQVFDRLDQSVDIRDYNLDIRGYTGATLAIGRQGGANAQDAFRIDATGATFTVTGTDASGVLQSGGLTFATYVQSGGVLTITFTGSQTPATSALVDAVASSLSYANQSDAPPANVTLAYTFRDGNAGAQGAGGVGVHIGTTTVTLTAVDDAAVSRADAVTAAEGAIYSGNVFANNGSGADSDAEGDAFSVIAINGSGAGVGVQVTLPSGARLTLNANGTFDYDPNGAFAFVPGPASGASNLTFTDTFTYTLTGGATSTVTVTLNGADTNGDILVGTSGDDVLDGGVGNDTVDYSGAASGVKAQLNDAIAATDGSGGRDTLVNIENLTGSAFDDLLIGSNGANVLTGGLGADILLGLGGNDILIGGAGAANTLQGGLGDDIYVVDANDTVLEFAGEGTDSIRTSRVNYVLKNHFENLQYTGAASFRGTGNAANNVIEGGSGDDFLSGGGGIDRLDGNGGADTADYMNAAAGVVASLFDGAASNDGDGASDILSEIENLTGSAFNDSLTGDAAANLLMGGSGDDVLNGRGGNDILQGGLGVDTVSYVSAASGVTVRLDLNSASDGEGGTDTLNAIENATGSAFNDTLFGNGLANVLSGGLGFDLLFGLAGDDVLIGGSGAANQLQGGLGDDTYVVSANDTIFELAGEGTDTVQTDRAFYVLGANIENLTYTGSGAFNGAGNAAANVITGGAGDDTLTGGQGNDTLRGGGGLDYVVLAGVLADYTVTDLGGGSYRIVDSVGGRDGTDVTTGIERVRFATGPTAALASLAVAPAPVLTDKAGSGPQVLPDLADDDFILAKDADAPQVMPGTGELFSARDALAGDLNPTDAWLMLTVNPDGAAGHTPDAFAGVWNHGGWNHDGWLN